MALNDTQAQFAKNLRNEREKHDLLQKEMAHKLNIPINTYNGYETGKRAPNLEVLINIASELNVSVDKLLGKTESRVISTTKEMAHLDNLLAFMGDDTSLSNLTYEEYKSILHKVYNLIKYELYKLDNNIKE